MAKINVVVLPLLSETCDAAPEQSLTNDWRLALESAGYTVEVHYPEYALSNELDAYLKSVIKAETFALAAHTILLPTHSRTVFDFQSSNNIQYRLAQLSRVALNVLEVWGCSERSLNGSAWPLLSLHYPYLVRDIEGIVVLDTKTFSEIVKAINDWRTIGSELSPLIQYMAWLRSPKTSWRVEEVWRGGVGPSVGLRKNTVAVQPWKDLNFKFAGDVTVDEHGYRVDARLIKEGLANGIEADPSSFGLL